MRVSAAYMGLWVLMMALVPEMIINDLFGVPVTQALGAQMQFTSVATAAIASMQWMVSSWAPEGLAKFARLSAIIWALFALLSLSLISSGVMLDTVQNYTSPAIMAILALLLLMKASANSKV
jgi:hypothetical protein|tara:strand:- start:3119 stop:3484 length:366 start_codon:yes stop_codon:yes gene_type:complete